MPNKNIMKKTLLSILLVVIALANSPVSVEAATAASKAPVKTAVAQKIVPLTKKQLAKYTAGRSGKLKKIKNVKELKSFVESKSSASYPSYYSRGISNMTFADESISAGARKSVELSAPAADASVGVSSDYSKTNVQVEGVDEADIVKTDGENIYSLSGKTLYIAKARPAEKAEVLSKIEFKDQPANIYLNGKNLVVYGNDYALYNTGVYKKFRRRSSYVFFKIFDVSNPSDPKQLRNLDFEGNYAESRMIGDYVYLVVSSYLPFNEKEPVIPRILDSEKDLTPKCFNTDSTSACVLPDIYYFDMPYDNLQNTAVYSINVKKAKEKVNQEIYLMSQQQSIYASEKNLYITYSKYISEEELTYDIAKEYLLPKLSERMRIKIKNIDAVSDDVLSRQEKISKVMQVIESYSEALTDEERKKIETELEALVKARFEDITKELEKTVIHKVALKGANLEYQSSGEVTGSLLNQFSMDESGEYFRVATTKNRSWSSLADAEQSKSYSNVYVLDKNMKTVGKAENLAKGERIYSTRFMQNRLYMVTFQQIDPLFVIDLQDAKKPRVLGELKIPGFSNYLHPYDNNYLIGLGRDTVANEWGGATTKGLKLSLFDVRDVKNPKEVDTFTIGGAGSYSEAASDHKAFLFDKKKNLLVIPATINDDSSNYQVSFAGDLIFKIDEKGFELRGKISHEAELVGARGDNYNARIKRNLYIDDILYSISDNKIGMNKLSDLSLVNTLSLKVSGEDDFTVTK